MAAALKIGFASPALEKSGSLVLFMGSDLDLSAATRKLIGTAGAGTVKRAVAAEKFKGKERSTLVIPAPQGIDVDRLVIVGLGGEEEQAKSDHVRLGGVIASILGSASAASILMEGPSKWRTDAEAAADLALGLRLRHYRFDKYKAKKREAGDGDKTDAPLSVTIHVEDPNGAKRAVRSREAVGSGVVLARDLVNEPPNVLDPVEFAKRAKELEKLGVEITILDEKQLAKSACARFWASGRALRRKAASSSCAGMVPRRKRVRRRNPSHSLVRALCSTPAVSPSSLRKAWKI